MQTLKRNFLKLESQIYIRYFSRALELVNCLNSGANYRLLGGRCLKQNKQYIRFKFGHYRLIVKKSQDHIKVQAFVHRKNLEAYIKRRCK